MALLNCYLLPFIINSKIFKIDTHELTEVIITNKIIKTMKFNDNKKYIINMMPVVLFEPFNGFKSFVFNVNPNNYIIEVGLNYKMIPHPHFTGCGEYRIKYKGSYLINRNKVSKYVNNLAKKLRRNNYKIKNGHDFHCDGTKASKYIDNMAMKLEKNNIEIKFKFMLNLLKYIINNNIWHTEYSKYCNKKCINYINNNSLYIKTYRELLH
jgi:hypothetical protein